MSVNLKSLAEAIQTSLLLKQATGDILDFKEEFIPETGTIRFDVVKWVTVPARFIEIKRDLKKGSLCAKIRE